MCLQRCLSPQPLMIASMLCLWAFEAGAEIINRKLDWLQDRYLAMTFDIIPHHIASSTCRTMIYISLHSNLEFQALHRS